MNLEEKNRLFEKMYECEPIKFEDIFEEYYEYGQQIKDYVTDTSVILNDALDAGNVSFSKVHKVSCLILTKEHTHL